MDDPREWMRIARELPRDSVEPLAELRFWSQKRAQSIFRGSPLDTILLFFVDLQRLEKTCMERGNPDSGGDGLVFGLETKQPVVDSRIVRLHKPEP